LVNDGTETNTVTWAQMPADAGTAPVIAYVTLAEDTPETAERFTNQSFTSTIVMAEDGKPASTKGIRGWVGGELVVIPQTDEIVGITDLTPTTYEIGTSVDPTDNWSDLTNVQTVNIGSSSSLASNKSLFIKADIGARFGVVGAYGTVDALRLYTSSTGEDNWVDQGVFSQLDLATDRDGGWLFKQSYLRVEDISGGNIGPSAWFVQNTEQVDRLEFKTNKDLDYFTLDLEVTQDDGAATGVVGAVDISNKTMDVVTPATSGAWGPANSGKYIIGEEVTTGSPKQYLKLDQATLEVIELQSAETPFTPIDTLNPTISFGATLGTADAPDDLLPIGTSIQTEVKAANGIAPDSIVESNPVTPISQTGPNATMHGLRFDSTRVTTLKRTNTTDNRGADFTFSFWGKKSNPQKHSVTASFDNTDDISNSNASIIRISNNSIDLYATTTNNYVGVSYTPTSNTWTHYVLKCEGGTIEVYVNGVSVGTAAFANSYFTAATNITVGGNGYNLGNLSDGYLSDVYFVHGQALPPETFGADFEGKWGPLDSAVVKTKIETPPPDFIAAFPDDQYNTSQVWSGALVSPDGWLGTNTAVKAFNGETTSGAVSNNLSATLTFTTSSFPNSSGPYDVRVYSDYQQEVYVGGTLASNPGGPGSVWHTISGVSEVTQIEIVATGGFRSDVAAIEINGRILVDNPAGFGGNSFFLPFDPEAPSFNGQTWSSFAVNNGLEPWTKAFDGVATPQYNSNEATSNSDLTPVVWEYTGSTPLTFNKLRIYARKDTALADGPEYEAEIFINDFEITDQVEDVHDWYEIDMTGAVNSSSLEKITLIGYNGVRNGNMRLGAVELDGFMLIDNVGRSAIGHDDSGNGNHFTDENFAVPGNTDQVWSAGATGDFVASLPARNMFDGSVSESSRAAVNTAGAVNFSNLTINSSLKIFTHSLEADTLVVNLGGTPVNVEFGSGYEWRTVALPSTPISFDSLEFIKNKPGVCAIEVDGEILIDKNVLDTVLDTPMKSYAVLETGANGNLEATAGGTNVTYMGEAGTDYYYEEDGVGKIHDGGTAFTSVSGKAYNFGQQPFATPLNTSQIWSDGSEASGGPSYGTLSGGGFTGKVGDIGSNGVTGDDLFGNTEGISTWNGSVSYTKSVAMWCYTNPDATFVFTINGTEYDVTSQVPGDFPSGNPGVLTTFTGLPASGTITKFEITATVPAGEASRGKGFTGWYIDGELLVDQDLGFGNLYQTWEEWNNVVTLRASNPEDVVKFEAIKTALENYEGDLRQFRADVVRRLVFDGFSVQELDALNVIDMNNATAWGANTGYEDGNIVTHDGEYWFALSSSYNNSPDDNDPEDWISMGIVE